ncbi:MAG: DUF2141 domain-containing protein [Flavobacteriales bacterium]|nr:DUF2141 domain-containing protein [Flavobacteriales bacterium]
MLDQRGDRKRGQAACRVPELASRKTCHQGLPRCEQQRCARPECARIPNEPYGFGNDARGRFGPPSFEEAAVAMGHVPVVTAVKLK